jgi:hypothetical protein
VPKPVSDLERYLAGELSETPDVPPAVIFLVAILFIAAAALCLIRA